MIRLEFVLRRKPSMSLVEFQKRWHEGHGPIVAKHATNLNILRYVQLHTLDDPMNEQMAKARGGMEPPYDGVAELWWTTARGTGYRIRGVRRERSPPKNYSKTRRRFIDLPNSPLWLAYEYPQVNPSEDLVARPSSSLVKLFFPLRQPCQPDARAGAALLAHQSWPDHPRADSRQRAQNISRCIDSRIRSSSNCAKAAVRWRSSVYRTCRSVD